MDRWCGVSMRFCRRYSVDLRPHEVKTADSETEAEAAVRREREAAAAASIERVYQGSKMLKKGTSESEVVQVLARPRGGGDVLCTMDGAEATSLAPG